MALHLYPYKSPMVSMEMTRYEWLRILQVVNSMTRTFHEGTSMRTEYEGLRAELESQLGLQPDYDLRGELRKELGA